MLLKIFIGLSLALNFLLAAFLLKTQTSAPVYQVDHVTDGDTFVLTSLQQIRLQNVDAPEAGYCGYSQAKAELEALLKGKTVRLEGNYVDKHGRRVSLVYSGDTLINRQMLLSGWGRFASADSHEKEKLKSAGEEAREKSLGVYGLCRQQTNPQNPQCLIKGNVRDGKKTYFFPGCGNYSNVILELDMGDAWFCSETEAQAAGFTKGLNCHEKTFNP